MVPVDRRSLVPACTGHGDLGTARKLQRDPVARAGPRRLGLLPAVQPTHLASAGRVRRRRDLRLLDLRRAPRARARASPPDVLHPARLLPRRPPGSREIGSQAFALLLVLTEGRKETIEGEGRVAGWSRDRPESPWRAEPRRLAPRVAALMWRRLGSYGCQMAFPGGDQEQLSNRTRLPPCVSWIRRSASATPPDIVLSK